MKIFLDNRMMIVLSALAGGLPLAATPVHAEQDIARIIAADPPLEDSRRIVRDTDETVKANQNGGKNALVIETDLSKELVPDESFSLRPPQDLKIATEPR